VIGLPISLAFVNNGQLVDEKIAVDVGNQSPGLGLRLFFQKDVIFPGTCIYVTSRIPALTKRVRRMIYS